ncbi:MAG: GFA family protein [Pseudomonadota bacterium]
MGTPATFSGGCQCGAVRYRIDGPLLEPHICHCRMCQKAAGNYFMPFAHVSKRSFTVTRGEMCHFHSSDPVRRGFCARCGTPLTLETVSSDIVYIALGSLDDPAAVAPAKQSGVESRMPWFGVLDGLPEAATEDSTEMDGVPLEEIQNSNRQHPDKDTFDWVGKGAGR